MPSQRRSKGTLQRQGVPIRAQLEGPRVNESRATYTSTTAAPPRPRRPRSSNSRTRATTRSRSIPDPRQYSPTRAAEKSTSGVGLLEAEYFAIIFILGLELFTGGTGQYATNMISFMKRATLATLLFFFMALVASTGDNAAKITKGIGALVLVAILVSSPGVNMINAFDTFIKANWGNQNDTSSGGGSNAANPNSAANTSAPATPSGSFGAAGRALADLGNLKADLLDPGNLSVNTIKGIIDGATGISESLKKFLGF